MAFNFEALTEATSGAVGGLLSTSILYPLDTCKTKYQAEVRAGDSRKYRSLFDVLREAVATRQILSLYQGLGTKNLQSVISQFIYFYSYSYLKNLYLRKSKKKTMGTGANLIVAASAGACTVLLTQPLDTASARMQTSTFGKSKGLWDTLGEGSWRQAFDGIGASLVLTSNPAIQYTVFEQLKVRLIRREKLASLAKGKIGTTVDSGKLAAEYSPVVLSALSAFTLGALSKTVATVVTYPAIRCKVMIQAAESEEDMQQRLNGDYQERPPKKMLDALRIIWHKEGTLGFYKGLQAQILKTILSASLMLMIKEKTSKGTWLVMMGLRRWWQIFSRKRLKQI